MQPNIQRLAIALLATVVASRAHAQSNDPPSRNPDSVFPRLDENGDGTLSADELRKFPGTQRLPDLFDRLDRDGDGKVTRAEFRAVAGMGGKNAKPEADASQVKLSEPAFAKGSAEEIARYAAASEYSVRHASVPLASAPQSAPASPDPPLRSGWRVRLG
jgi:hypothetical protein